MDEILANPLFHTARDRWSNALKRYQRTFSASDKAAVEEAWAEYQELRAALKRGYRPA